MCRLLLFYYALVSADSFSGEGTDVLMFCHTKQHRAIWDVVLVFSVYARWLFCGFSYRAGNRSDRDSDVRDSWFLFLVGEDRSVGYVKSGVLDAFFLSWAMLPAALARSVPRKCRTIPFFGRFLESCYITHPRTCVKVPENPVRGYEMRGKTTFRQKKCCTIRNLLRKSES